MAEDSTPPITDPPSDPPADPSLMGLAKPVDPPPGDPPVDPPVDPQPPAEPKPDDIWNAESGLLTLGDRPDWIPENFWDKDGGAVKIKSMIKMTSDLRKQIGDKPEAAPESPDKYEFTVPEDMKDLMSVAEDDPVVKWFREAAHGIGLDNKKAQTLFEGFNKMMIDQKPEPVDIKAELGKLGENGQALIDDMAVKKDKLEKWGVFNDQDKLEWDIFAATADGVRTLQKILANSHLIASENPIPITLNGGGDGSPSGTELDAMMFEPIQEGSRKGERRYLVDTAFREKVDGLYQKRYGNKPAGSSHIPVA